MFDLNDEDYDGQDVDPAFRAKFWYGYILGAVLMLSIGIAAVWHHWS